jgi:hypothetical protein
MARPLSRALSTTFLTLVPYGLKQQEVSREQFEATATAHSD